MLINTRYDTPTEIDSIHNYYEGLVFESIQQIMPEQMGDSAHVADIVCVALNHLPPRYIRHKVDMSFYLSPQERQEMEDKVTVAVNKAIAIVKERIDV
jgi:competence protein ComFB